MPTISESELESEHSDCINCNEFEGAIWLCGEGMICERCFSKLADIEEQDLFNEDVTELDFEVPVEIKSKAKAKLMYERELHATDQT